ncbi:MAG TPA: hypothetical protein VJ902_02445 [Wenzhouxiangellaceae bacterium]|nr:hypothetical protein [Wenzhouxiangellaceae bacterium]
MNFNANVLKSGAAALLIASAGAVADNHEDDDAYHLVIHHVHAKVGHIPEFRAGMEAYSNCLEENGAEDGYSVWRSFDGDRTGFHIVSRFGAWADFDEEDEVSDGCWGNNEIRAGVFDHMASWETSYAEKLPAWSGDAEEYTVVQLHNFRVDEGDDFRALVGEITGYMKAAEYEHQADWFNVMTSGYWDADYFAVTHFENFAALDEDRLGVTGVLREAVGEERAEQIWEDWGDSLADDKGYWRETLVLQSSMGYTPEDD